MTDSKIRKLVLAALMAALCTIMTMVIQVPSPMQGYVNLGDCAVLMSAWVLGPLYGGAAAGIGSALADLLSGYAHYVPGTFAIKLVMAVAAALIFRAATKKGLSASSVLLGQIVGGVVAEVIMVLGYFAYASLWLGKGLAAAASIPGNIASRAYSAWWPPRWSTPCSAAAEPWSKSDLSRYANCRQTQKRPAAIFYACLLSFSACSSSHWTIWSMPSNVRGKLLVAVIWLSAFVSGPGHTSTSRV